MSQSRSTPSASVSPRPASPKSIFHAPTVIPVHHVPNYTLAYDVSDALSDISSSSQSISSQECSESFDVLDAATALSDVTCRLTEIIFKMAAASPDQSRPCLPFIGQILEKCEMFVAVHQHNEDDNSETSSVTSTTSSTNSQATSIFIDNLSDFIEIAAPSGVFSRRRSKRRHAKRMRSLVHTELFTIWQHATQLFTPIKATPPVKPKPLPTISLKDVNSRAIANVPSPHPYPIQSCSLDSSFYKDGNHTKQSPFGTIYGYRTNLGVLPVPDQPVHGYVWNHEGGGWTLCATLQKEDSSWKPRPSSRSRGREKG